MSRVRTEVWEKTNHDQLPWVNTSLIGDYILNPQLAPAPAQNGAAEVAKVEAPGASLPEPQSAEDLLWESAQHSNLRADYQAYLAAFPNGFFARMAMNRIAALENSGAARSEQAPESGKEPEKKDWRAEIGTAETEKALNMTPAEEKEIQLRLIALDLYKGPVTGSLDPATRRAITEWRKSRGAALSSYLGPMQLAELRQESEDAYQNLVAAQSAPKPKAGESVKSAPRAAGPRAAGWAPAVRAPRVHEQAARELTKTPRRHWAGRPPPPRAAVTESAAAPHCNGNPTWCEKAGLPVDSGAPPVGRPYGW